MLSITEIIVGLTCIVSFLAFSNPTLNRKLIFNAYVIHNRKQYYRLISSGLIHADFMHLFINMYVLFSFGNAVEFYYAEYFEEVSDYYYIVLYMGALLISSAPDLSKHKDNPSFNSLGASGAVSAIVFASILFNPLANIYLFAIVPIPGILLGLAYLLYTRYRSKHSIDHINHSAHLYGAIFGIIFTIAMKPKIVVHFFTMLTL